MRAEDNPTDSSYGGFTDVELLFDEEGHQHEKTGETSNNEVGPMRLVYRKLFPHGYCEMLRYGIEISVLLV